MTGSFDPALNMVYWGVGNALDRSERTRRRKGDNLYTASVIALDIDTGKLKWHSRKFLRTSGISTSLPTNRAQSIVAGECARILVLNKGGYTCVLDRVTGEYLKAYPFVEEHNWPAASPKMESSGRVEPVHGKPNADLSG